MCSGPVPEYARFQDLRLRGMSVQSPSIITGPNLELVIEPAHKLTNHFRAFFRNINPSPTWRSIASSQYVSVKGLLESDPFLQSELGIQCRTQGSYDRHTSIHSINDIDIVAFCTRLHYPPQPYFGIGYGTGWTRDRIFQAVEAALAGSRYRGALLHSNGSSMCVKLDLGIKMEILPVVPQYGAVISTGEPFYLWRPSRTCWELGYAQEHQGKLSEKNVQAFHLRYANGMTSGFGTDANFIPAIKVLKHLCSIYKIEAVSFHIECLLFALPNEVFWGTPASFILQTLWYIAQQEPVSFYLRGLSAPCGDRNIFSSDEWQLDRWLHFHQCCKIWKDHAMLAISSYTENQAIEAWRELLGSGWFPMSPVDS